MVEWTKSKKRRKPSRLVVFMENTYLDRTAKPIYGLTFLLPLIILYEVGTLAFNTGIDHSQIRVVSFLWIQQLLGYIGLTPEIAWIGAPLMVIVILLAMQITSKAKWKVNIPDHFVMAAECVALAVPLIVLSMLLNRPAMEQTILAAQSPLPQHSIVAQIESISIFDTQDDAPDTSTQNLMGIIVTGIGAGIYEELVFRLLLIGLLVIIMQDVIGIKGTHAIIIAVLISSLVFSLHHHIVFIDGHFVRPEAFSIASFSFRTFAGVYFAVLYAIRGYGITAGTHAFYDIIIAVLNSVVFTAPQGSEG